jgi:glycosyltransferase involved in cell wall biosynthesis
MRPKIHFHSDCTFFAGCENMLVVLWASRELRESFDISFSYRFSEKYRLGLERRMKPDFPVFPLKLPDLYDLGLLPDHWPLLVKRVVLFLLRMILTCPLLVLEIWMLWRLFSRIRPAIVHINNGGYPAALSARASAIAARLAAVPAVVMVVNNLAADYSRPARWAGYALDRIVAFSVDRFVTGSRVAQAQLRKVLRLKDAQSVSIHNGIALRPAVRSVADTRALYGLDGFSGVTFGVVAILRPNKGHRVLLEAVAQLRATQPETASRVRVLIEGSGPIKDELLQFVAAKKLSDCCIFVGDDPFIMAFMNTIDVLVLPSVGHEDFPNVVLEAMGMAKPVIASRLAGTTEQVVDGETGYLVTPGDVQGLALAMARLAQDDQARKEMGQAGQRRFRENFNAEIAARNYRLFYQSLAGS